MALYTCSSCDATFPKWLGRCTSCREYGTVEETATAETRAAGVKSTTAGSVTQPARRMVDVDPGGNVQHIPSGFSEVDRVLGGGIPPSGAILLFAPPGAGKSTLCCAIADKFARTGRTALYVTGEESAEQVSMRARRIGANADTLLVAAETDLSAVLAHIEEASPDLVIVDSLQTIASPHLEGRAGSLTQTMEVATVLTRTAKARKTAVIFIGQVTKASELAGPRQVEHLVDTVLAMEGDTDTGLRVLRTVKNRYGPADEIACFEHTDKGLEEILDPSGLFATHRDAPLAGTCITVAMEGRRPLLTEIQALASPTPAPNPRRGVSGLDSSRAAMLLAVTERHGKVRLYDKDIFLATVGGLTVREPAVDTAICAALFSICRDAPLPLDVVCVGEVALSGDLRRATNTKQRLQEAQRLGFTRAIAPPGAPAVPGVTIVTANHISEMFHAIDSWA
jgi:DNA repair protein RadA/Sms